VVKSSEVKYENNWMRVREDQVIRPDGKDGIYGVVEMHTGVCVLAMDEEQNVYLTREYHYGAEKVTYEAVSGAVEEGETPLVAAKRELEEEAGLVAEEWTEMGFINPWTSTTSAISYMFLARKLKLGIVRREGTETMEIVKFPFSEVVQVAMENRIEESTSQLLVFRIKEKLKL
jgi:8-oxo-dGTP pyrophosphatase MutT (NUDIX family)